MKDKCFVDGGTDGTESRCSYSLLSLPGRNTVRLENQENQVPIIVVTLIFHWRCSLAGKKV
jgi:hypothetical protein